MGDAFGQSGFGDDGLGELVLEVVVQLYVGVAADLFGLHVAKGIVGVAFVLIGFDAVVGYCLIGMIYQVVCRVKGEALLLGRGGSMDDAPEGIVAVAKDSFAHILKTNKLSALVVAVGSGDTGRRQRSSTFCYFVEGGQLFFGEGQLLNEAPYGIVFPGASRL